MTDTTAPLAADLQRLDDDDYDEFAVQELEFVSIHEVMLATRRRMGLLVGGVVTTLIACFTAINLLTPVYSATAQLLINTRATQLMDFEMVLSGLPAESPVVDTEVGILTSEALARTVVSRLQLEDDPEFNASLREPSLVDGWLSAIGGAAGAVASVAGRPEEYQEYASEESDLDRVVRAVGEAVQATRREMTFLIDITATSEDPDKASLLANSFGDAYLERQLETKFDATRRANDWLAARLGTLGAEVEAAERQVEAYRAQAGLFSAQGVSLVESQVADLSAQLARARAELTGRESRLAIVRARLASGESADAIDEALASGVIGELRGQQAEIIRRRAELESDLGPRHPSMVAVNRELRDLEAEIDEEIGRILSGLESELAIVRGQVSALEASRAEMEAELADSSRSMVRLRELERTADANRVLYESFLARFEETNAQEGVQEADAQIISEATPPLRPSFPNKGLMGFGAIVLSLGVGVALVALAELFDSGFRGGDELEQAFGAPTVGQVPFLTKTEATVDGKALAPIDYVIARPFSVFAESYRTIKAALVRPRAEGGGLMMVFTSGSPGEGKTVNTAAFARTLALSGTRVLAIDGDLRRRELSRTFGLEPQAGLIEVLSGECEFGAAIAEDSSGAHVLPLSPVRYTPQDVFASPAFAGLLETLRAHYDVLLFDSAPVLAVADTLSLLKHADAAVVMVRWARTSRGLIKSVMTEMRNVGARNISFVLTQVDIKANAKYGYGYHDKKYARYYAN